MRRIASAAIVAILGAAMLSAPAAADTTMITANSASFVTEPVPGGALISIFTRDVSLPTTHGVKNPWMQNGPNGLRITATCDDPTDIIQLPILWVGEAYGGDQINLYLPNLIGPEPWGSCRLPGHTLITVYPDAGLGAPFSKDVITVDSHPGIFAVGNVPSGTLTDGGGVTKQLTECVDQLPANPSVCPPKKNGVPAKLDILLTGSERFKCTSCTFSPLIFELAPVTKDGIGSYSRQILNLLEPSSLGIEKATLVLTPDIGAGEHLLRVRFEGQPVIPPALTVEFGQPT